jgi:hypothetical protein
MTAFGDIDDVTPVALDVATADRLLAGTVAPEDAPPGYAAVTRLLEAAWAEPTPAELRREAEVVAMTAAVLRMPSWSAAGAGNAPRRSVLSRPSIAAALIAAGIASSAALSFAGVLPGPAQDLVGRAGQARHLGSRGRGGPRGAREWPWRGRRHVLNRGDGRRDLRASEDDQAHERRGRPGKPTFGRW